MKSGTFRHVLKHTFQRGNIIAVLAITIFPVVLGELQFYFGANTESGGFENYNIIYNFVYSLLVTASLYFGCSAIIESLNVKLPWEGNIKKRIIIEVLIIFTYTSIVQYFILTLLDTQGVFSEGFEKGDYFTNILFGNTITLIVVAIIEGIFFFKNWKESVLATERLQKEHLQSSLANLRAQLDPHFMFNSLNVLSSLIKKDPDKAEKFVDDFARVYRYLLDVKDEMAVTLRNEIDFVERYLSLQKIRFDEGLQVSTKINPEHLNQYLPPLSLQEMVGNAIKHNEISKEHPLKLELVSNGNAILVKNNIQRKHSGVDSTGIGLKNLKERYKYLGKEEPSFEIENRTYMARLPLIKIEE